MFWSRWQSLFQPVLCLLRSLVSSGFRRGGRSAVVLLQFFQEPDESGSVSVEFSASAVAWGKEKGNLDADRDPESSKGYQDPDAEPNYQPIP